MIFPLNIIYRFALNLFGNNKKKYDLSDLKGYYFVNDKMHIPKWVIKKFGTSGSGYSGTIESFEAYAKGKHYEYKLVVIIGEHTHWDAIVRRKLRHK